MIFLTAVAATISATVTPTSAFIFSPSRPTSSLSLSPHLRPSSYPTLPITTRKTVAKATTATFTGGIDYDNDKNSNIIFGRRRGRYFSRRKMLIAGSSIVILTTLITQLWDVSHLELLYAP